MPTNVSMARQQHRRGLSAIPILIASIALISITWMGVMIDGGALISELSKVSKTVRDLASDTALLVGAGFALSLVGVSLSSLLLVRKAHIFLAIWIFLLSISEAKIPALQQLSLALRYPMMLSLLLVGSYALWKDLSTLNFVQITGLFMGLWYIIQLFVHPVDTNTLLLLPMQFAMFIGILCGLPHLIHSPDSGRKLAYSLAGAGIVSVIVNYLSFIFVPHVFIAGRFSSWFSLPTGFSNNFILCITPLIWAFLDTRRIVLKLLFGGFLAAGLVLIILSGTRNAILALVLAALIFTFFWKRRLFIYVVVLGALSILGALAFNFGLSDLGQAGMRIGNVSDKEVRYLVWSKTWSFIIENPFWGYGPSMGLENIDRKAETWELLNTHNALLGIWVRIGLLGALAFLMIYMKSLISSYLFLVKRRFSDVDISALVLFTCLLSQLFVSGFFEENLSSRASIFQALWAISVAMIFIEVKRLSHKRTLLARKKSTGLQEMPFKPKHANNQDLESLLK